MVPGPSGAIRSGCPLLGATLEIWKMSPLSPPAPLSAEREFTVLNKLGVHARPAADFVRCARRFASKIEIVNRGQRFPGQEMLGVLLAGLSAGTRFQLLAEGPDAKLAVDTLGALLQQFADSEKSSSVQCHACQPTSFGFAD